MLITFSVSLLSLAFVVLSIETVRLRRKVSRMSRVLNLMRNPRHRSASLGSQVKRPMSFTL